MRIAMVLEKDFPTDPPDLRVEKEVKTLKKAGYDIHLISLQITSKEMYEIVNGIDVYRIPIKMHSINDWTKESVESHFHSKKSPWVKALNEFVKDQDIEVIHVHDLPLVWVAAYVASENKIPVVFDMHEIYPPLVKIFRKDWRWDPVPWVTRFEKECLNSVDRVIVTVDESKDRLVKMGVDEKKIAVVMNSEAIENMGLDGNDKDRYKSIEKKLLINYTGAFAEFRGLEYLIRSMPYLLSQVPNAHLLLVGGGYNKDQLEELINDKELNDHVTITGWVKFQEVPYLLEISDICVIPHYKNEHTDTTIVHKLFQYMLMGKPIVASDNKPVARIINECNCGIIVPDRDVDALSKALVKLALSKTDRIKLGKNGRDASENKYNWKREEVQLLKLYSEL